MLLFLTLAWLTLITGGTSPQESAGVFRHVRSEDAKIRTLLAAGYDQSATFKQLVDEIDAGPGIVYISHAVKLAGGIEGALLHGVAGSPELPVLRVLLKTNLGRSHAIATIAHELQHVVEVLRAGPPRDGTAISRIFARLRPAHEPKTRRFETEEAQRVTRRVLDEIRRVRD